MMEELMLQTATAYPMNSAASNIKTPITKHAWLRMNARGIPIDAVQMALIFGRVIHERGAQRYSIGKKEVKEFGEADINLADYEGVHVICSKNGEVMTTYRNRDFKSLRSSRRRPASQRYGE